VSDEGNVIELFPPAKGTDDEHDKLAVHTSRQRCHHRGARLDADARRVYCRECNVEIDAYEVLERIAREPERTIEERKTAQRRLRQVRSELKNLEREERNAKARKRRRTGKSAMQERVEAHARMIAEGREIGLGRS
jgi:hypothetical protein